MTFEYHVGAFLEAFHTDLDDQTAVRVVALHVQLVVHKYTIFAMPIMRRFRRQHYALIPNVLTRVRFIYFVDLYYYLILAIRTMALLRRAHVMQQPMIFQNFVICGAKCQMPIQSAKC